MRYYLVDFGDGTWGIERKCWYSSSVFLDMTTLHRNIFWWEGDSASFSDCKTDKEMAEKVFERAPYFLENDPIKRKRIKSKENCFPWIKL